MVYSILLFLTYVYHTVLLPAFSIWNGVKKKIKRYDRPKLRGDT